jgi:MSHA biogenesis protein MshJ
MKLDVQTLHQAWQARKPRERWILCAAALVVPLLLADTLVWNPWRLQMKALNARVAQADQELQQLSAAQAGVAPPDAAAAKRLEDLRQRLVQAEQAALDARKRVVSPEQMAATLRGVTEARGAAGTAGTVNVVALRSLPVTPAGEAGGGMGAAKLYRHSFELHVEGSYADIARYIESLEQTATALRWNAVELDASRHPTVAARLEVFTLSEHPSWIQL